MDLLIQNDPNRFMQIDESLQNISVNIFNSEVIDTSKMSIMEVVKCIQLGCSASIQRIVLGQGITNRRGDANGRK